MTDPCTRWMALTDRAALGEQLAASEQAFCAQHASSCAECAREQALYGELSVLIEAKPKALRSRRWWWAVAAAAAALLLLRAAPMHVSVVEGELHAASGERTASLDVGTLAVARERACLKVEPGVRACFAAGSRLRVQRLHAHERRLELLEGKVIATLEPQPAGTSFGIVTREGSAIAVGTVFSVEVPARGEVITRVMHGVVAVRDRAGQERRLQAHRATPMAGPIVALSSAEEAQELVLSTGVAAQAEVVAPEVVAPVPVVASVPVVREPAVEEAMPKREPRAVRPARVEVASAVIGPEASTNEQPTQREAAKPEPAKPEQANPTNVQREQAQAEAAKPEQANPTNVQPEQARPQTARASEDVTSEWPARAVEPVPEAPTPRRLLRDARERSAKGDLRAALALYRQLFASAPTSAEAKVAEVPYGELLLTRGQARDALRAFEHYLHVGGPLAEEASYGRIRALRALGDEAGEQRALEAFRREFPSSALTKRATP